MLTEKNVYVDLTIEEVVYKRVKNRALPMKVFKPLDWKSSDRRGAVIFWFGGGFYKNDMDHFRMQSEYFTHLGLVCFTPDYRLTVEEGVKIPDCIQDAKAALLYVAENAAAYGVDREKIVVSGGSAGGTLAGGAVMLPHLDIKNESSVPCAMVLFNPVLTFTKEAPFADESVINQMVGENGESLSEDSRMLQHGMGTEMCQNPEKYSCFAHLKEGLPPLLIMQGSKDVMCQPANQYFCKKYREYKNYCELEVYEGCPHGFFNWGRSEENIYFYQTKDRMEHFLIEQGLLV